MEKSIPKNTVSTSDEIWQILKEVSLGQKETDRKMQETDRKMQETDRKMQETDRLIKETNQETKNYIKETSKQIRKLENMFSNKWGELVESLVSGCLLRMLKEKDIEVTGIFPNIETQYKDSEGITRHCEIDIMARNGHEIVVVEVKSTLGVPEVEHFLNVLKRFTLFFPEYKDKKIYGAVAYLKLYESADRYAMRKGLFVIKATGDSARITNKKDFKPLDFSPKS